jgi:hypothetical protein
MNDYQEMLARLEAERRTERRRDIIAVVAICLFSAGWSLLLYPIAILSESISPNWTAGVFILWAVVGAVAAVRLSER